MKDYTLEDHEFKIIICTIDARLRDHSDIFKLLNNINIEDVDKYKLAGYYNDSIYLSYLELLELKKKLQLMDSLR